MVKVFNNALISVKSGQLCRQISSLTELFNCMRSGEDRGILQQYELCGYM